MMNNYYGFIYKTILPDGRYYIGQHKIINQKTLDPMYFGSGVIIKDYIKSKGIHGLIREIMEFGNNHDELNLLETKYITQFVLDDLLNINLDSGGKHIFSRIDKVKEKIGQTMSEIRRKNPEKWPARRGEKNNRSVNWRLISPSGEEFNICGDLNSFCKTKKISANTIKKAVREGWIPRRGSCAGWLAFNLDLNIGTTRDTLNHGEAISGANNPNYKNKNSSDTIMSDISNKKTKV